MNLHIIKGNIGSDARISKVGERKVANFSVVTEFDYKRSNGGWDKEATWHNVTAWQGFGICDLEQLKKGTKVMVVGRNRTRKYTDKGGFEKEIYEIVAESVDILSDAGETQHKSSYTRSQSDYQNDEDVF